MPPRVADDDDHPHHEKTSLFGKKQPPNNNHLSFGADDDEDHNGHPPPNQRFSPSLHWVLVGAAVLCFGLYLREKHANLTSAASDRPFHVPKVAPSTVPATSDNNNNSTQKKKPTGPYQLLQRQQGDEFFDYYDFYDGEDSQGSAGYNRYVSDARAFQLGIANVVTTTEQRVVETSNSTTSTKEEPLVYMGSTPTSKGPRESVRLEGRTLFHRGLFVVDVRHMPAGCGVWPAFWLTNEEHWPDYGEIDVVEGINNQTLAKTALHTSDKCSMYAHVAGYNRTGIWDRACTCYMCVVLLCFFFCCIGF